MNQNVLFFFSPEVWKKVRSVIRIKVANYTMLVMILGCITMVITGKRARDRGETIMQRNLDWHKKYSENKEETSNISIFGKQNSLKSRLINIKNKNYFKV